MQRALELTLPWWIAGPVLGLVISGLLGLANKRFGVLGGVTDLVHGSSEGRGPRSWSTGSSESSTRNLVDARMRLEDVRRKAFKYVAQGLDHEVVQAAPAPRGRGGDPSRSSFC